MRLPLPLLIHVLPPTRSCSENEKASIFQRDETLTTGDDWVRVAALCDLTAASNGEKDTARLREILLRLKH